MYKHLCQLGRNPRNRERVNNSPRFFDYRFLKTTAILFGVVFLLLPFVAHALSNISASAYLGQTSWIAHIANSPSGSVNGTGFGQLSSLVLDPINNRLFVSDYGNNRILVYQLDSSNNITSTTPINVLGACDTTHAGSGAATTSTFGGGGVVNLAYDQDNARLFVSDSSHSRVLAFSVAPGFSNCEAATFILGNGGTGQSNIGSPDDVAYDRTNHRLFVSDENDNRAMAFNVPAGATSSINGEGALFVLGQPDFNTTTPGTSQTKMNTVSGISYDSINNRLFVSDLYRIMVFPVSGSAGTEINGEPATFELGEPSWTATNYGASQTGFANGPDDNNYDTTNNLLVATDYTSGRVMVWTVPSNATYANFNNAPAQNVIGQSGWTTTNQGTNQNLFTAIESPHAYDPVNNRLFSYECGGYRVLQFNMIHITTASLPAGTVGTAYNQTVAIANNQGSSQAYSVYSGSLPGGLSLNSSTGAITGTPTTPGSGTVTIEADDNFTGTGLFFDRKTYTMNTISNDATLSSLTIATGTLTPTFASGITAYADSVSNETTGITITPTANQANATIKVNNVTVASGSASGSINLNVGSNTITTVVTAQDSLTTDTYIITVTRAASPAKAITAFSLNGLAPVVAGTIDEVTHKINLRVDCGTSVANLTPTITTTGVSVSPVSGIANNFSSPQIYTVTAADGTTQTYSAEVSIINCGGGGNNYMPAFTVIQPTPAPTPVYVTTPTPTPAPTLAPQNTMTPEQRTSAISQIKQQLISLITQLIQLLTLQISQMGR
jgi:hypothetical protein